MPKNAEGVKYIIPIKKAAPGMGTAKSGDSKEDAGCRR